MTKMILPTSVSLRCVNFGKGRLHYGIHFVAHIQSKTQPTNVHERRYGQARTRGHSPNFSSKWYAIQ